MGGGGGGGGHVGVPGRVCSAGPVGGGGRSGRVISPTGWWAVHTERGGWMRIVEWVGGVAEGWRQEAYEDGWQAVRVVGGGGGSAARCGSEGCLAVLAAPQPWARKRKGRLAVTPASFWRSDPAAALRGLA